MPTAKQPIKKGRFEEKVVNRFFRGILNYLDRHGWNYRIYKITETVEHPIGELEFYGGGMNCMSLGRWLKRLGGIVGIEKADEEIKDKVAIESQAFTGRNEGGR